MRAAIFAEIQNPSDLMAEITTVSFPDGFDAFMFNSCFVGGEAGYACFVGASRVLDRPFSLAHSSAEVVEPYSDCDNDGWKPPAWVNGERNAQHVLLRYYDGKHFDAFVPLESAMPLPVLNLDVVWQRFMARGVFTNGALVIGQFGSLDDLAHLETQILLVRRHSDNFH